MHLPSPDHLSSCPEHRIRHGSGWYSSSRRIHNFPQLYHRILREEGRPEACCSLISSEISVCRRSIPGRVGIPCWWGSFRSFRKVYVWRYQNIWKPLLPVKIRRLFSFPFFSLFRDRHSIHRYVWWRNFQEKTVCGSLILLFCSYLSLPYYHMLGGYFNPGIIKC